LKQNKNLFSKSIFYRFETFVFDFDGTLVFSNKIKKEGFFHCVKKFKNGEKFLNDFFDGNEKFDRFFIFDNFAKTISKNEKEAELLLKDLLVEYNNYTVKKITNLKPIEGSIKLLNNLKKRKKKIYINSATPYNSLLLTLNRRKLTNYFDKIFGMEKSKIENLRKIKEHSKTDKKLMLMIGDGKDDLKAAELFKIKFYPVGTILTDTITDYSHLI
tara:strand:+ start:1637 stop:2281 length:645 start_codon:yes stop_codon:yes gene_type:complete